MAFTQLPNKKPGDLIKSADWNEAIQELIDLENDKVNRAGDTIAAARWTLFLAMMSGMACGIGVAGRTPNGMRRILKVLVSAQFDRFDAH